MHLTDQHEGGKKGGAENEKYELIIDDGQGGLFMPGLLCSRKKRGGINQRKNSKTKHSALLGGCVVVG